MRDSYFPYIIIFANFLLSVLALIAYYVWLIHNLPHSLSYSFPEEIIDARRKMLSVAVLFTMAWLFITRYKNHEGHAFALVIGITTIALIFISVFYDADILPWTHYLGAYISISHIIYAFTDIKQLLRGLNKNREGGI